MKRVKTISANGYLVSVKIKIEIETERPGFLSRDQIDDITIRVASKCMIIIPDIPYVHVALSEVKVK